MIQDGIGWRCDEAPHFLGGYAEYHYLRARTHIFRLPDDLPTESLIGAGCALITAIHGVERTGIAWQDNVVVQGAGPVGIAALAIAKSAGAGRVIVIGAPKHRLALAKRFGADEVIDLEEVPTPAARLARVRELTAASSRSIAVEPSLVRIASPSAIPSRRATVTVALAVSSLAAPCALGLLIARFVLGVEI